MRYEKLSSSLAVMLDDFESNQVSELAAMMHPLGFVEASSRLNEKPGTVAFIYCDDQADLSHTAAYGCHINQSTGSFRTGLLAFESIDQFSNEAAVLGIIPSKRLNPVLDVALPAVHVPELKANKNLSGRGVVVGIVDTGIDGSHPAFTDKIHSIWDQTANGPGIPEGAYGLELRTKAQIQTGTDEEGHGTHVAGIASGNDPTYDGIASEATIVMVKSDLQNAHIADGIRYIFRVATDLGLPAVVNLSLGGHFDAHDGTDPLSQMIAAMVGPGRIVCCAAGNEGNDNIHGAITVPAGGESSARFLVPPQAGGRMALLNGWYSAGDQLAVAIESPGNQKTPYQQVLIGQSPVRTFQFPEGKVSISTPGPSFLNNDFNFVVQIQTSAIPVPAAAANTVWKLWLQGNAVHNGRVDVWSMSGTRQSDVVFTGTSVDGSMKIGSPGCCPTSITVASYTTKIAWTDKDGMQRGAGLKLNDLSDFSSPGPLRSGVQKPDVTAPGAMIVSALSNASKPDAEPSYVIDDYHLVMAGTSMATPFIAGVVALLLQQNGTLDPAAVKERLKVCSSIPGQAAGARDTRWGYGLMDAAKL